MERTPLTLEHGKKINAQLDVMGMHLSEFSFPNLYLFRDTHQYEVISIDDGNTFISGLTYDKKRFIMPLTKPAAGKKCCIEVLTSLLASGDWDFIFPVPEEWVDCFNTEKYHCSYNQDDSDYLYLTEKLQTYPGKAMHKKKNLLNQFLRYDNIRTVPISGDVIGEAREVLAIWQETSPQEMSTSDYHQCHEALDLYHELKLTGFIVFIGSRPAGFLIGEPLNSETFTIHFAKADISFKGVYQFLFSHAARHYCPEYLYMNQEQDMGNEGLRKTKISYRPDLIAHKYRAALIDNG
ncbi:MAG: hypothetical protein B0D92_08400 [Spirochaeta sp. LUC14_002_19_P3]|nr:MAG: hypothetical protein B0D92_08400 [Spirochaeta sp. LUC14_002_19_P3]